MPPRHFDQPATGDDTGSGPVDVGVDVDADPDATSTITNDYRSGGLQILKEIDGPGAAIAAGPFVFSVTCSFNDVDDVFSQTVVLARDGGSSTLESELITGLPV